MLSLETREYSVLSRNQSLNFNKQSPQCALPSPIMTDLTKVPKILSPSPHPLFTLYHQDVFSRCTLIL